MPAAAWGGRMEDRNSAFAHLLFSSGLRLTKAASLLTLEVPQSEMGGRRCHSGRLAPVVTKSKRALTIVALAAEAGVPRNALTQRHTDLRNLFYNEVRALGWTPDSERRLRQETTRLKRLREEDRKAIQQLKTDNETLVGALHVTQLQNEELRRRLAESGGIVHAIGRK